MDAVRWGMIGCGKVTEIKSGPGFYKADNSALVAVMARNRDNAVDYARRHGVARVYERATDLIQAPEVDARREQTIWAPTSRRTTLQGVMPDSW